MSSKVKRIASTYSDILLTNSLSTTYEFDFSDEGGMVLYFPATWTACNLTVYAKNPVNDTYYPLINNSGSAVTISSGVAAASKAVELDDSIFATKFFKIVTDNAANDAIVVGGTSKA